MPQPTDQQRRTGFGELGNVNRPVRRASVRDAREVGALVVGVKGEEVAQISVEDLEKTCERG